MFRSRTIRTIPPILPRRIAQSPFRRSFQNYGAQDDVKIQRVKFRSRVFTWRRLATPLVYAGTAYIVLAFMAPGLLRDILSDDEDSAEGEYNSDVPERENENEGWDKDDVWFIPLGLWAKERPRQFYKGSDPEWQEYVRFAKDQSGHRRARENLAVITRKSVASDQRFKKILGTVDIARGNYWLDIQFPPGPPLEYERSGIEITPDNNVSWTTRPVTLVNYQRFNKIVWPHAALFGVYQSGKLVLQSQYRYVRGLLGLSSGPSQEIPSIKDTLKRTASPAADSTDNTKRTETAPAKTSPPSDSRPGSPSEKNIGQIELYSNALNSSTLRRFMETFTRRYKGFKLEPPRGSVTIQGMIGVQGDQGRMTLLVTAFYDPKTEQYLAFSAQVSSLQPFKQRPKGGP